MMVVWSSKIKMKKPDLKSRARDKGKEDRSHSQQIKLNNFTVSFGTRERRFFIQSQAFVLFFNGQGMRDIDYMVKDKLLFEQILDMEFYDPGEKGFFFNGKFSLFSASFHA